MALLAFNYAAFGATNTFEMGTSWNTGVDWSSGSVPAATDALLISQAAYGGVLPDMTLDSSFTVQTLSFDSGTDNFSIDANVSGTTAQTLTFNAGTNALGGAATVELSPATTGTVTMGGTEGLGNLILSFGSNPATIDVANSAATLVFGPNLTVNGSGGLTETGSGTLIFGGISSYAGNTTVNGGTLQITGTINTASNNLSVDGAAANTPAVILGTGGYISDQATSVGVNGTGSFAQTGGTLITNDFFGGLYLGQNSTGSGVYDLSGGLLQSAVLVGISGTGNFIQTGGTANAVSGLILGYNQKSSGAYSLSAGYLQGGSAYIGYSGTGSFIQTGGTNSDTSMTLGSEANSRGTYTLSGGVLQTGEISGGSGTSVFNFNGGTLFATFMTGLSTVTIQAGGAIINNGGGSMTISTGLRHDPTVGAPAIDGGLTEFGTGDLILAGANTYTGPTTVTSGRLTLLQGGALAGTTVTIGSINSAATLQISGTYTIGTSGTASLTLTANTGNFSLTDGVIDTLTIGGSGSSLGLILGGGNNIAVDVSGTAADSIVLGSGRTASVSGTVTIIPTLLSPYSGTSTILSVPGGGLAGSGTFVLGSPLNNFVGVQSLVNTGTSLNLVSQFNPVPATAYFTGQFNSTWDTIIGSGTDGMVNFSTDSEGLDNASQLPFSTTNVSFYAANTPSGALATTLGRNFTINSLTIDGTTGGSQPVSIAGNTLTIEGTGGNGVILNPGAGALTISSAITLGGAQMWTNNSSNPLTISGSLSTNSFPLTISGSGTTVFTSPAVHTGTASVIYAGTGTLDLGNSGGDPGNDDYLAISSGNLLITGTVSHSPYLTIDGTGSNSPEASLGGSASWAQSAITVGLNGTGTFVQTGGTVNSYPLELGEKPGSNGTYILSSGTLSAEWIQVGDSGTGSFFQTGGTVNQSIYYVNIGLSGTGTYILSGGLLNCSDLRLPGGNGRGSFIQTGGTNATAELDFFPGGTYSLNGGLFQLGTTSEYSGTFNFDGGILQAVQANPEWLSGAADINVQANGAILDTNGFAISIVVPLLHDTTPGAPALDGGLTKIGLGTLTLTASNTYTGPTQVIAGTLSVINGSLGSGPVTVGSAGSAATLQLSNGNYDIGTSLTLAPNNGTLSLVDGEINQIVISGNAPNLSLGGGDVMDMEVSGTLSDSILLAAGGTAIIAGTNVINLTYLTSASGTDVLIDAPGGGLNAGGEFVLGNSNTDVAGSTLEFLGSQTLLNTGTALTLVEQINPVPATAWFTGTLGSNWNASSGGGTNSLVNFSTDSAGVMNAGQFPYPSTNVHFYSSNANGQNLASTLGQNFTINSITMDGTAAGSGSEAVSISGYTLTLQGTGGAGITLNPGAGSLSIASAIVLGGPQTWSNNSSNPLVISGSSVTGPYLLTISGTGNTILYAPLGNTGLTMIGSGMLTIAGVETNSFNTTVLGGTLAITGTLGAGSINLSLDDAVANLTGNGFLYTDNTYIGVSGSSTLNQSGGTHDVSNLYLGFNTGSTGTYVLTGGTLYNFLRINNIGYSGTGLFVQSGGVYEDSGASLGENPGGNGTYLMSGGDAYLTEEIVGDFGTGNFIQTGGTNAGPLSIADGAGSRGAYSLNGGTLSAVIIGLSGTSAFNFNGGTLLVPSSTTALVSGLTVANVQADGALINTNGFADTIPQPLLHDTTVGAPALDGGVTKSGAGTLTLSAFNTYTGPTTVLSGTLIISGSLSASSSNAVVAGAVMEVDGLTNPSVSSMISGVLRGSGNVGSISITAGGTLAPGFNLLSGSAGTLTANGNVTLANSTSAFSIRLGVTNANDHDELALNSGNVSLNGADLVLTLGASYATRPDGFIYILINGQAADATISGQFAQGNSIVAPNGDYFQISYGANASNTGPGSDVLLVAESIPEPAIWQMSIAGIGVIFALRRWLNRW